VKEADITKNVNDFSAMPLVRAATGVRVVKILAPLACYWLGLLEVEAAGSPPGVPPESRRSTSYPR
jgi:hypothetical protein